MSEMIEQVARAICSERCLLKELRLSVEPCLNSNGTRGPCSAKKYQLLLSGRCAQAKAAIEAMRNPTDAMVQAGIDEGHKCGNWYPAMIDAALKGDDDE